MQKMHFANSDKPVNYYNLDVIISVGYRVKSKNGIAFRKWATKVLKDNLIKGYSINQRRLDYLEKPVKLIDIANRMDNKSDAKDVLRVINDYTKALDLLDDYDHKTVKKIKGNKDDKKVIDNNTLTTLTLFIAESNLKEKDIIIDLVMNFLV